MSAMEGNIVLKSLYRDPGLMTIHYLGARSPKFAGRVSLSRKVVSYVPMLRAPSTLPNRYKFVLYLRILLDTSITSPLETPFM